MEPLVMGAGACRSPERQELLQSRMMFLATVFSFVSSAMCFFSHFYQPPARKNGCSFRWICTELLTFLAGFQPGPFLGLCVRLEFGGSFRYRHNVSLISAPTQHAHKFFNDTWQSHYTKLSSGMLTLLWSIIAFIFSLGMLWCNVLTIFLTFQMFMWAPYLSMACIFAFILSFGLEPGSSKLAKLLVGMLFPFVVAECSTVAIFIFFIIPETKNKTFLEIKRECHKLNFGKAKKLDKELLERQQLYLEL